MIKVLLIYCDKSHLVLFTFTVNLNLIEFLSIIICIPDVKKYEKFIGAPVNACIIVVVLTNMHSYLYLCTPITLTYIAQCNMIFYYLNHIPASYFRCRVGIKENRCHLEVDHMTLTTQFTSVYVQIN